jgi:hypothetical protein
MPTIDEETLRLYEEMKAAVRDGDLLTYANKLARSMATRASVEPVRKYAAAEETGSNPAMIRPPNTTQPVQRTQLIQDMPQVRQNTGGDGVRVFNG